MGNGVGLGSRVEALEDNVAQLRTLVATLTGNVGMLDTQVAALEDDVEANELHLSAVDAVVQPTPRLCSAEVVGKNAIYNGSLQYRGTDGEPAAWLEDADASTAGVQPGRVKVNLDYESAILEADVALPWLIDDGGLQLLPRVGQTVYFLYFDTDADGNTDNAVVLGYRPVSPKSVPHVLTGTTNNTVAALSASNEWGGIYDAYSDPVVDSTTIALDNSRRHTIQDPKNEVTLSDHASDDERTAVSIRTDGHLVTNAAKTHHTMSNKYYQRVTGESLQQIGGKLDHVVAGDRKTYSGGNERHETHGYRVTEIGLGADSDPASPKGYAEELNVHGKRHRYVSGDEDITVGGQWKIRITGDKSEWTGPCKTVGWSTHWSCTTGATADLFFGNKTSLTVAALLELNISGGLSISLGALKVSVNLSLFTANFNFSAFTFEEGKGVKAKSGNLKVKSEAAAFNKAAAGIYDRLSEMRTNQIGMMQCIAHLSNKNFDTSKSILKMML